jgi:hypothetical protein
MYYRVDMTISNPPMYMVFDSNSNLAALKKPLPNCGQTIPKILPGATPVEVQQTKCNNSANNITLDIIQA